MLDREALQAMLAEGCSLEEIGRRVDRHPSTISYWLRRHGLRAIGAPQHTPRGGLDKRQLEELIAGDLSIRDIAIRVDRTYNTVRYWLRRYGLETTTLARRGEEKLRRTQMSCPMHGKTDHVLRGDGVYRCARCRIEAVTRYRREAKRALVKEFGGACALCGYDECIASLHFHHRDPSTKRFGLGGRGLARAMDALREEAAKCVLLCANCHGAVEAGVRQLSD
jgi:transposase